MENNINNSVNNSNNWLAKNKTLVIVLAVLAILAIWTISSYNRFVSLNENIDGLFAQVDNQYKRRFDLIPDLVNVTKSALKQEKEIFGTLADARSRYAGASSVKDKAKVAGEVDSAISRLLVITENYPNLRSSEVMKDLLVAEEGSENRIAVARMDYNNGVRDYNKSTKKFPSAIIASLFNFNEKEYFESTEEERVNAEINLE